MILKLSEIVELHSNLRPIIEKAILDVVWDEEDDKILFEAADQFNRWGADPHLTVELDVPLGLGDTDALIRLVLSLYEMHAQDRRFQYKNFRNVLQQVNPDAYLEVSEELFGKKDE